MKLWLISAVLVLCMIGQVRADSEVSYHTDTRGYNTFGVVTSHGFPMGVSFWGFTDIHGAQNNEYEQFDLAHYFMEYRLGRATRTKGLKIEAEYNDFTGTRNSLVRAGWAYTTKLRGGWIQARIHPWDSTTNNNIQVSSAFYLPLKGKWSLSGWIDYDILEHGPNQWLYEPAVNYQLTDNFTASVEYRFNGYEGLVPGWDSNGIAIGLILKL